MPVYEYKCPRCDFKYIETRGILEKEKETKCKDCNVDYLRVFNVPTVTFNGSGFYATDKKK